MKVKDKIGYCLIKKVEITELLRTYTIKLLCLIK